MEIRQLQRTEMKKLLGIVVLYFLLGGNAIADKKNSFADTLRNKINTIDDAWWVNDGVEYVGPEPTCRSTSTNDFVLIGNTKYKCSRIGWEKV